MLDEQGAVLKWHGTVVDMHDWKRGQEKLRGMQAELAQMTRVMTMGELAASIAHEVNQPLTAIAANGESSLHWLTQNNPDIEKIRMLTNRVVADARRASDIIGRIRVMANRRAPEQKPLSIDDVINESLSFLRHELQEKGVIVSIDLAPGATPDYRGPHPAAAGHRQPDDQCGPGDDASCVGGAPPFCRNRAVRP